MFRNKERIVVSDFRKVYILDEWECVGGGGVR
jgi:hypothetical protein